MLIALIVTLVAVVTAVSATSATAAPTVRPAVAAAVQPAAAPAAVPALTAAVVRSRNAESSRLAGIAHHVAVVRVVHLRAAIVSVARKQLGDRYSAGASGPNAFDCSGLTRYVYRVVTGKELPHYSGAQFHRSARVSKAKAEPGDLVFFMRHGAHHVGIYIGHGHMIDAAGYGEGVRVSPISGSWWGRTFSGIGRILPAV
jgi:cell wall-associated NlpC family hydrolase